MTGLEVAGINLRIEDVLTADEVERRNRARRELDELELASTAPREAAAE